MTAYEKWDTFDGNHVSAWLYKITYNKSINRLRRAKFLVFGRMPEDTVTPAYFGDETGIMQALKILKPQDRALLYARIIEGYSYEELAQQMGQSAGTLRKRYERAKVKLAEHLTERGGEAWNVN